jgi:putative Mg2+ transporter-C (MgtC) family protein
MTLEDYLWLGDLNRIQGLAPPWVGLIEILASVFCGAVVGIERERRDKPAGLRTVILISVGSTIFTLVSCLVARAVDPGRSFADPGRIAAQVAPGIGFLGAGAIIRGRGGVTGLTTAATIWAVAAVGVAIGAGFVAAGLVCTLIIFLTLSVVQRLEWVVVGRCRRQLATALFRADGGKTRVRLQDVLDRFSVPDERVAARSGKEGLTELTFPVCTFHRDHRTLLREVAEVPGVEEISVGSH